MRAGTLEGETAQPLPLPEARAFSLRLWLRAIRLRHWLHFLLLPLAGLDLAADGAANASAQLRGLVISFSVLSFGYLLNGLADRHMDGARKNPLSAGLPSRSVPWVTATFAALAAGIAATGGTTVLFATALALASGVAYSVGPRLKRLPVLGTVLNVIHFAPLLWVGLPAGGSTAGLGTLAVCFSALLLQNQLLHEASDSEDDRKGKVLTTYLLVGRRWTAVFLALLGVALTGLVAATPSMSALTGPVAVLHVLAIPWAFLDGRVKPSTLRRTDRLVALATGATIYFALRFS